MGKIHVYLLSDSYDNSFSTVIIYSLIGVIFNI